MAQWKETLEPYVRVQEKIKVAAVNPTAGEDLIIGCTIISDAGPSTPTLITSQKEYLATYASQDLTEDYMKTIDALYGNGKDTVASTMWLNGYRLAGAGNLLVVRAFKGNNIYFAKPLSRSDLNAYILKDGQLLKKVQNFKIVVDADADSAEHNTDGWAIAVDGVGVIGNRTTDEGAQYDYYVQNLQELVDFLNDSPKFFSPSYKFYSDEKGTQEIEINPDGSVTTAAKSVIFDEVYLGANFLDTTDPRCPDGVCYVVICEPDWEYETNQDQKLVNLVTITDFEDIKYYATNAYNSGSPLKLRIRRFNHDAVLTKELSANDANAGGESPYTVLESVLATYEAAKKASGGVLSKTITDRDFYELAVFDPSVSGSAEYFNIGNIYGRGDMTETELNSLLNMIQVQLPDDLLDLGLDYYGYVPEDKKTGWVALSTVPIGVVIPAGNAVDTKEKLANIPNPSRGDYAVVGKKTAQYYKYIEGEWVLQDSLEGTISYTASSLDILNSIVTNPDENDIAKIGKDVEGTYYQYTTVTEVEDEEIYVDLSIDPEKYKILNVNDSDLLKALDKIEEDEIYQTEGLSDLGNTNGLFQSYMANMAINFNYFYAVSTVNSTNYLAIANSVNRLAKDHYKLYCSAPWDVDTGTVGFKFYCSPSVLYWESVNRNRGLDREFMSMFGQRAVAQVQSPVVEFNKRQRQLLLSKRINTVLWDTQIQTYVYNDAYTKESENNILNEDGNSRLAIRISKSQKPLLRQFHGRQITDVLYSDMYNVIDYWFRTTIMPMTYTIDDYRITIADINSDEDKRANRVNVLIEVRYNRSLKFIEVYHNAIDMGMAFTGTI